MLPDEYSVGKYVHANEVIHRLREKQVEVEANIFDGTLSGHTVFDEDRIHMVAPHIETMVVDAVTVSESISQEIDRWKMRRQLFNQWLGTLDENERLTLTTYPQYAARSLRDEAQAEIREIETYVAYHFGYEPPAPEIELTNDPAADAASMAEFFN